MGCIIGACCICCCIGPQGICCCCCCCCCCMPGCAIAHGTCCWAPGAAGCIACITFCRAGMATCESACILPSTAWRARFSLVNTLSDLSFMPTANRFRCNCFEPSCAPSFAFFQAVLRTEAMISCAFFSPCPHCSWIAVTPTSSTSFCMPEGNDRLMLLAVMAQVLFGEPSFSLWFNSCTVRTMFFQPAFTGSNSCLTAGSFNICASSGSIVGKAGMGSSRVESATC
mmetsp:Transcript_28843/g.89781  ORF Transcript_28843/g.89781 Transcript_28843/m.89781 type:complete len:227 (-) Transcript_28843:185-865(-)